MPDARNEDARLETIEELTDLLVVVQEMGRRLANETHGEAYASVRELNELLHQARRQIQKIHDEHVLAG